ncbi:glycosyltransferase [Oxalobacter aliiformigenes]|uniref:glycosyltransferase family 2 protein n=1 Tax=Oxalobacter aliiformigenes TaxID=2946593 RepID=UPI0022B074E1|nr:glycosyltransferase [Oxalobacter aliiformigenes]WAV90135.1 glycosyltransferase [Oxalobacter aliiformigenes]
MENDLSRPLLSVIVPVYRVETYLPKCLDSLVGQTYADLEIILVDDGSPDRSGAICDEYAARDSRIVVIHQENRGASQARNAGLDRATGEFVAFVDSDDYLDFSMYENLMKAVVEYDADIVISDFFVILESGVLRHSSGLQGDIPLLQAQEQVLADRLPSYLWNKIYRRTLFDGIRYERIRGFEDLQIMPHLFRRARKVAFVPEAGYYYNCLNLNALTATFNHVPELNVEMKYGMFVAWKEHETVARELGSDVVGYAENRAVKCAIGALVADRAHSVLAPAEREELTGYLESKKTVIVSGKHRMLKWFARHSTVLCRLYDYGSFVWRRYRAKRNKMTSRT